MNSRLVSLLLLYALLWQPASVLGNEKPIEPEEPPLGPARSPRVEPPLSEKGIVKEKKPKKKAAKKKEVKKNGNGAVMGPEMDPAPPPKQ